MDGVLLTKNRSGYIINHLEFLNIDYFQQFTKGSGVKIVILDSELDLEHREFEGLDIDYQEFIQSENKNYHGTAVTSLIAGNTLGVAPLADITHLKMLSDVYGSGVSWDRAMGYATRKNPDIICMSIGTKDDLSLGMRQTLQLAKEKGIMITAPSGNEGVSFIRNPANDERVIAVGGIDRDKKTTRMSNKGKDIEMYALSDDILVANSSESMPYTKISGTSFANAIAVGQLALIISYAKMNGKEINARDFLGYYKKNTRTERKILDMKIVKEVLDIYLDL